MRAPALVIDTEDAEQKGDTAVDSVGKYRTDGLSKPGQDPDDHSWMRIESIVDCFPEARQKLDDLFFQWISQESSISFVRSLLERVANGEELPHARQAPSPRSPMASTKRSTVMSNPHETLSAPQPPRSPPRSPKRKGSSPSLSSRVRGGGIMDNVEVITDRSEDPVPMKVSARKKSFTKDSIPPFYMPRQVAAKLRALERGGVERKASEIKVHFDHYGREGISLHYFVPVCKNICGFPTFFNTPLFVRIIVLNRCVTVLCGKSL